ncbi:MAG: TadE/TadG family type IV pilus assembly protein [Bryobacteraceae bacterium]
MRSKRKGHSVMELALFLPFLLFLFIGAFDWGFYSWALIATQSAARSAALYTSSSSATAADSSGACTYALAELTNAPNVFGSVTTCSASPVTVTATSVTGADGTAASQVSVTYQTINLIPIPSLLPSQMNITRVVQMKVQ